MQEKRVSYDAVLINVIFNEEETFNSLRMKLENDYGIEVTDYTPVLTEDELHQYYEDVRSSDLWGRFCDQIYIPGDRDGKMMADYAMCLSIRCMNGPSKRIFLPK